MQRIILSITILAVLSSCGSDQKKEVETEPEIRYSLKKDLLGEWRNIEMKVKINGDKDSTLHVPKGKWEEVLQIKPIRTVFNVEGTYTSEYRDLNDSLIMTSNGTWSVKQDTLIMDERGSSNAYATKVKGDIAEFEGYIDWDEDGEADDYYWGRQERQ